MGIINSSRKQTAVYWPKAAVGTDDYGNPALGDPVEIRVRWEDSIAEFIDINGDTQISSSMVTSGIDLVPGGVLMLGELTDITDAVNPKENAGAFEIKRFDKLPTLRATDFLRTSYL